jgi:hypothetical protein
MLVAHDTEKFFVKIYPCLIEMHRLELLNQKEI